ncbi:hypothetical protein Nepgr_018859 [Nepenthes gracilis]|uniref:Uncharacterized protein n=1 Tax=Nepenthes gracilis TaxID=150966 RepID=A0AAD3SSX2_NEPGR|nr:hypothetical protein Nepgr_018859 [Nepenthes gracilis]
MFLNLFSVWSWMILSFLGIVRKNFDLCSYAYQRNIIHKVWRELNCGPWQPMGEEMRIKLVELSVPSNFLYNKL